jgi:hypothetical protein
MAVQGVWATIHIHMVMEEYSCRNFFEHPSISAVIMHHLASHHTRPDVGIEDHVKNLEATVLELATKMNSIESHLARVEAKNKLTPLKKTRGGGKPRGGKDKNQTGEEACCVWSMSFHPALLAAFLPMLWLQCWILNQSLHLTSLFIGFASSMGNLMV